MKTLATLFAALILTTGITAPAQAGGAQPFHRHGDGWCCSPR